MHGLVWWILNSGQFLGCCLVTGCNGFYGPQKKLDQRTIGPQWMSMSLCLKFRSIGVDRVFLFPHCASFDVNCSYRTKNRSRTKCMAVTSVRTAIENNPQKTRVVLSWFIHVWVWRVWPPATPTFHKPKFYLSYGRKTESACGRASRQGPVGPAVSARSPSAWSSVYQIGLWASSNAFLSRNVQFSLSASAWILKIKQATET